MKVLTFPLVAALGLTITRSRTLIAIDRGRRIGRAEDGEAARLLRELDASASKITIATPAPRPHTDTE